MPQKDQMSVKVRMYRQGLGDCFLLTFSQKGKKEVNMLIDCGLLQGTDNGAAIMTAVANDIKDSLPSKIIDEKSKKWLDVVVLTHEHVDHISGFSQARDVFDEIHFGQVWTGWTEDESHPKYGPVRERFKKQLTGLKASVTRLQGVQGSLGSSIESLLHEFLDEGLGVSGSSGGGRAKTWKYALDKSVKHPRYCCPGETFLLEEFDDVRVYVLGPPMEYERFTRVNPPEEETYREERNNFALADSFFAAVAGDSEEFDPELYQPFEEHLRISPDEAQSNEKYNKFFKTFYGFEDGEENSWRRINDDWLSVAGALALNLDSYTNNTCLALAIEFVGSKKVLLFPGDAQFANWISWQKLAFEIPDDMGGKREINMDYLLKQTVLYKVGHHGSHNATLKKNGLEKMIHPELVAMIPVDRNKAQNKKPKPWQMPEQNLFRRLRELTRDRILLADEKEADFQIRCNDLKFKSSVTFEKGTLVRDSKHPETKEPLYVELKLEL